MKNKIKTLIGKHRQIGHVAFNRFQRKRIAPSDESILRKLFRRIIEHGHMRARRRRKDRSLLPAARSQTQNLALVQVWKPILRNRLRLRQQHFPQAAPRSFDDAAADRQRPLVSTPDFPIPRNSIMPSYFHLNCYHIISPDYFT